MTWSVVLVAPLFLILKALGVLRVPEEVELKGKSAHVVVCHKAAKL